VQSFPKQNQVVGRTPLRISRIVYFTDLIHIDSRELPVGIVAEITLPDLRGIETALRPSFTDAELALRGPRVRKLLVSPNDYLWPISAHRRRSRRRCRSR
jgi:hypothetical protein